MLSMEGAGLETVDPRLAMSARSRRKADHGSLFGAATVGTVIVAAGFGPTLAAVVGAVGLPGVTPQRLVRHDGAHGDRPHDAEVAEALVTGLNRSLTGPTHCLRVPAFRDGGAVWLADVSPRKGLVGGKRHRRGDDPGPSEPGAAVTLVRGGVPPDSATPTTVLLRVYEVGHADHAVGLGFLVCWDATVGATAKAAFRALTVLAAGDGSGWLAASAAQVQLAGYGCRDPDRYVLRLGVVDAATSDPAVVRLATALKGLAKALGVASDDVGARAAVLLSPHGAPNGAAQAYHTDFAPGSTNDRGATSNTALCDEGRLDVALVGAGQTTNLALRYGRGAVVKVARDTPHRGAAAGGSGDFLLAVLGVDPVPRRWNARFHVYHGPSEHVPNNMIHVATPGLHAWDQAAKAYGPPQLGGNVGAPAFYNGPGQ